MKCGSPYVLQASNQSASRVPSNDGYYGHGSAVGWWKSTNTELCHTRQRYSFHGVHPPPTPDAIPHNISMNTNEILSRIPSCRAVVVKFMAGEEKYISPVQF